MGDMREICNFCDALKCRKETNGMCCSNGKNVFSNQDPPHLVKSLLNGGHPQSKHFLDNIRLYNSAFQMTSFGVKQITNGRTVHANLQSARSSLSPYWISTARK